MAGQRDRSRHKGEAQAPTRHAQTIMSTRHGLAVNYSAENSILNNVSPLCYGFCVSLAGGVLKSGKVSLANRLIRQVVVNSAKIINATH